jgi:hypothetical protein
LAALDVIANQLIEKQQIHPSFVALATGPTWTLDDIAGGMIML